MMLFQEACARWRLESVGELFSAVNELLKSVAASTRLLYWGRAVLITKSSITCCSSVGKSVQPVGVSDLLQAVVQIKIFKNDMMMILIFMPSSILSL
jgi:hypothetical protein